MARKTAMQSDRNLDFPTDQQMESRMAHQWDDRSDRCLALGLELYLVFQKVLTKGRSWVIRWDHCLDLWMASWTDQSMAIQKVIQLDRLLEDWKDR
jgi:hypothetical protein